MKSNSLDEVYETLEERGVTKLSKEAIKAIENICDNEIEEVYENYNEDYINILDINELNAIDAYANLENIEVDNHCNTTYYNEETDSIDWEGLANRIYLNGIKSSTR